MASQMTAGSATRAGPATRSTDAHCPPAAPSVLGRLIPRRKLERRSVQASAQPRRRYAPTIAQSVAGPVEASVAAHDALHAATAPLGELGFPMNFDEKFETLRLIGRGSFGDVWLVREIAHGDLYAVKALPKARDRVPRSRVLDKVSREAGIHAAVTQDCPHISDLYGVYEDTTHVLLVMEHLSGGTLAQFVPRVGSLRPPAQLTERQLAFALHDALAALARCHATGVYYGDVKPSNLMLATARPGAAGGLPSEERDTMVGPRPGGLFVKLVDFGCSQWCAPDTPLTKRTGTPVYIAPEVFMRKYDLPADIWSLGMVAYHLASGALPFWEDLTGLTSSSVVSGIMGGTVDFDEPGWAGVSSECKDFIATLLRREAGDRPTAAQALAHPWLREMTQVDDDVVALDLDLPLEMALF
ncbi:unnamed protein product [Pedinophyceae sp. YPF-701]|nr:unnamed protein product [Pedinophyceae sp. YPF-701]